MIEVKTYNVSDETLVRFQWEAALFPQAYRLKVKFW